MNSQHGAGAGVGPGVGGNVGSGVVGLGVGCTSSSIAREKIKVGVSFASGFAA